MERTLNIVEFREVDGIAITLKTSDAPVQIFKPTANTDIVLPPNKSSGTIWFIIYNAGTTYDIVVKNEGGATLQTISHKMPSMFYNNDGTWLPMADISPSNLGLVIGTDVQAHDATLDSIAALGTAADKIAYTTGVDTWAEAALTAFARTLLDDTDAATARGTLGLVIGTDVEAWDAVLDNLKTKAEVALADADATLTAAQMEDSGIFTITPTAARTLTTDTAANLVAGISGVQVGSWFNFTVVDLAAYDVTLAAGAGVTITGNAVANNNSATFKALFTNVTAGTEAVTIYRI